jgi:hypothetical protein
MFLKRRLAAFAAVIAALAVGVPVGLASAAPDPATDPGPVITGPDCPEGYSGPTNLATGCPWWMMTYSVEWPAQQLPR